MISAYCAELATDDKITWATYMRRITGLVRPGGTLMTAALRRSRGYRVGGKTFPSPDVDENDMRAVLEPCFGRNLRSRSAIWPGRNTRLREHHPRASPGSKGSKLVARRRLKRFGKSACAAGQHPGRVRTVVELTRACTIYTKSCMDPR